MFTTYVNQMRRNYLLEATRKKAPEITRQSKSPDANDLFPEDNAFTTNKGFGRKKEKTKEEKIMDNIERYLKERAAVG